LCTYFSGEIFSGHHDANENEQICGENDGTWDKIIKRMFEEEKYQPKAWVIKTMSHAMRF
jgi:hypothetical protein